MLQGLGLVALLAACSCPQALGLQIIAGTTSSFTTLQSTEQLIVAVHPPSHRWDAGQAKVVAKATPTLMRDKEGQQYLCYVPQPAPKDNDLANQITAVKPEVPMPEVASPFGLLDRLSALCLYRVEGLWTYEVCYKKHTRQFRRPSANDKGEEFSCGQYTGDEAQSEEIKVDKASPEYAQLKYVSHNMTNGAPCALSGANRTSEVRFMCMRDVRDNMITSVREFPTCNYIFTVATPFLCKHPEFKPPEEVVRTLHCKQIQTEQPGGKQAESAGTAAPAPAANLAAEVSQVPEASSSNSSPHEGQGASQGDPVRHQDAGGAQWEAWPTDPGGEDILASMGLLDESRQAGYGRLEDEAVDVDGKETAEGVDQEAVDAEQEQQDEEAQAVKPARTHDEL